MTVYVDFNTIREDFNAYKVENGQILKTKTCITVIKKQSESDQGGSLGFLPVSNVETHQDIDTEGWEESTSEKTTDDDITKELNFELIRESINIYETKKSLILLHDEVTKIFITNKKDHTGSPILRFKNTISIEVIPKNPEKVNPENS